MSSNINKLAGYISSEIVAEFKLGQSNEDLDKYAAALARAIHKYATSDLEVKTGIQVESSFTQTTSGALPGDPVTTTIVKVKGQTVTAGKVF